MTTKLRCIASLSNGQRCPANAYKNALTCGFHGGTKREALDVDPRFCVLCLNGDHDRQVHNAASDPENGSVD